VHVGRCGDAFVHRSDLAHRRSSGNHDRRHWKRCCWTSRSGCMGRSGRRAMRVTARVGRSCLHAHCSKALRDLRIRTSKSRWVEISVVAAPIHAFARRSRAAAAQIIKEARDEC
jgi:hypothetical protein